MAVVHSDLYIGSLSILDMGQADKSCFSLVSQTEFFLICPLRPCHAFCESFGHDKSYENALLKEGQNAVFCWKSSENHFRYLLLMYKTKQNKSWFIRGSHGLVILALRWSCTVWFALWMYLKIVLPWNSYGWEATFLIPWEGSYRTRYRQMILPGKVQPNASSKRMNFKYCPQLHVFSRPELMCVLLPSKKQS